jgi:hypothetical protein
VDAWPAAAGAGEYELARKSNVETLLIGGTLDFATPPQWATRDLLPQLPNGRQVVLDQFGHSTDFWTYQSQAGSRLINSYLASGEVDRSLYKLQRVDFTPEVTLTALAKGIAGTMVGLALLTVLWLLWMAIHVRRRGGYGRRSGAVLRSVWPVVLGFGGWFLGVLIVITTLPGTALDDELLAGLSIGLPVGLCIYLAWVDRDWSGTTKVTGFAAALAGSLVGAWLGLRAAEDLLVLLTAIAGSIAGANLLVVALDIAWDLQARNRFARAKTEALPSTSTG